MRIALCAIRSRRVEYLLAIEGARKEGQNKQQAPPELLEEVFELNESLDELREAKVIRRRHRFAETPPGSCGKEFRRAN